jgi:methyl-accepting chemotaxis protein
MHPFRSLTAKLVFSFFFLVLLIAGLTLGLTFRSTQQALTDGLKEQLKSVAVATASQVDGDVVAGLKPGDETSPEFLKVRDQLLRIRKDDPQIKYSYIMRPQDGGVGFVVDDTYGIADNAAKIGDQYVPDDAVDGQSADLDTMLQGMQGVTVDPEPASDKWGTFLSAYAPVLDSQGQAVAFLGVDMDSTQVAAREHAIRTSIFWVLGIGIALATLLVAFFSRSLTKDIRRVNQLIATLQSGKLDPAKPGAKHTGELSQLDRSIEMLESEIRAKLGGDFLSKL